jgi:cyclopropane-fatty-acyl-phospholipid synthase
VPGLAPAVGRSEHRATLSKPRHLVKRITTFPEIQNFRAGFRAKPRRKRHAHGCPACAYDPRVPSTSNAAPDTAGSDALLVEPLLDRGLVPDALIRAGIRRIVAARLAEQEEGGIDAQSARFETLMSALRASSIAVSPEAANAQHYELPPAFFEQVLGRHLKYSSAWWPPGVATLDEAEERMLRLSANRAQIEDGHSILELGCGWGSLTLFLGAAFPRSRIVGLSNSAPQRRYILEKAAASGLRNVEIVTADVNQFDIAERFDRIVSVEMFEHVRNYPALFERLYRWLAPDGRLFVHVFAHRRFAYPFEDRGGADWMARYFFTGGMMPSDDLFLHVQDHLAVEGHWRLSGEHYQRTAEAWLTNMDARRAAIDPVLADVYGANAVTKWRVRWRVFFMACAEMFGYRDGTEWIVSHYRFRRRTS